MKGEVVIDPQGEVTSSLPLDDGPVQQIGILISNILQDLNSYMRLNGNAMGDLKKTTLLLGKNHEVTIIVGEDSIKASV
jgi:hypothetical protein